MASRSPFSPVLCAPCLVYDSASFYDSSSCHKCRMLREIEASHNELDSWLRTLASSVYATVANCSPVVCAARPRAAERVSPPVHVSNRFSPFTDTPTAKQTLVNGDSILRNVKLASGAAIIKCIPGARAGSIQYLLKLLAKVNRRMSDTVVFCCPLPNLASV